MQSQSFDAWHNSFNDWASSLETFKESVLKKLSERKEPRGGSDGAGVFWTRIRDFMRFLAKEEKEDDPDVVRLRELFNGYARLEGEDFKKALIKILDLCLKICDKFKKKN